MTQALIALLVLAVVIFVAYWVVRQARVRHDAQRPVTPPASPIPAATHQGADVPPWLANANAPQQAPTWSSAQTPESTPAQTPWQQRADSAAWDTQSTPSPSTETELQESRPQEDPSTSQTVFLPGGTPASGSSPEWTSDDQAVGPADTPGEPPEQASGSQPPLGAPAWDQPSPMGETGGAPALTGLGEAEQPAPSEESATPSWSQPEGWAGGQSSGGPGEEAETPSQPGFTPVAEPAAGGDELASAGDDANATTGWAAPEGGGSWSGAGSSGSAGEPEPTQPEGAPSGWGTSGAGAPSWTPPESSEPGGTWSGGAQPPADPSGPGEPSAPGWSSSAEAAESATGSPAATPSTPSGQSPWDTQAGDFRWEPTAEPAAAPGASEVAGAAEPQRELGPAPTWGDVESQAASAAAAAGTPASGQTPPPAPTWGDVESTTSIPNPAAEAGATPSEVPPASGAAWAPSREAGWVPPAPESAPEGLPSGAHASPPAAQSNDPGALGETMILNPLQSPAVAAPQAEIMVENGPDRGHMFRLAGQALTMGRSPDNDLILRDPATSGHHARLERRGSQFYVVDLGSTNGTLVNGEPIQERELGHGDRITVGQNQVKFSIL